MEFLGVIPLIVLVGMAAVQAFLIAMTLVFSQVGAGAAAHGTTAASQLPVPDAWRSGASVREQDARIHVRLRVPEVLPLPGRLRVEASAQPVSEAVR